MSKKFEKIVNTPIEVVRRAGRKLRDKKIPENTPDKIINIGETQIKIPVKKIKKGARVGGLVASGMAIALLWMIKYLTLDNHLTRKLEELFAKIKKTDKEGKEKLWRKFIKKNPNFVGHIAYYMAIAATLAGIDLSQEDSVIKESVGKVKGTVKEWVADLTGENKLENLMIDPSLDDDQWEKQMDAITPYVVAHMFLTEGYIETAYYDNGTSGTLTFGAGFTIADAKHRNFAKQILGRSVGNGSTISVDETKKLTEAWCRQEIYPKMKRQFTAKMPARTFISLVVAAYNAGENTFANGNSGAPVRDAVNNGKSTKEIANLLVKQLGKIRGTQWGGMPNKYAVCALYMLGEISDDAILDAISEAPYTLESVLKQDNEYLSVFDSQTMERGRLLIYESQNRNSKAKEIVRLDNINELLQKEQNRVTRGTVQKPVKTYMTDYEVRTMRSGKLFRSDVVDFADIENTQAEQVVEMSASEKLNEEGENLFFEEKYDRAIEKFKDALEEDPKNYIVYSNLSIAYYKNQEYKQGLEVVQGLIRSDLFAGMPNNIKAYTYYNAALCREKLGDTASNNAEKQEHYAKAKENIDLAKRNSGQSYENFEKRLSEKMRSAGARRTAYKSGIKQIRKQNAIHDVLIYGEERKMA